jgi:hypothetical protein
MVGLAVARGFIQTLEHARYGEIAIYNPHVIIGGEIRDYPCRPPSLACCATNFVKSF